MGQSDHRWRAGAAVRLNGYEVAQIRRLGSGKDFISLMCKRSDRITYSMHSVILSQWREYKMGVMWQNLRALCKRILYICITMLSVTEAYQLNSLNSTGNYRCRCETPPSLHQCLIGLYQTNVILYITRYIPVVATPGSGVQNRLGWNGLANCQSVKKSIAAFLVLLRPVLNVLMVAKSMTLWSRRFHLSITHLEKM